MEELCRSPDAKTSWSYDFGSVRGEISQPRTEPTVRIVHQL
jgi:hypothetical protein